MSAAHSHTGRVARQVIQQQLLPAGARCPTRGRGAQVQVDQLRGLHEGSSRRSAGRVTEAGVCCQRKHCLFSAWPTVNSS